jgi:hypothetical protein
LPAGSETRLNYTVEVDDGHGGVDTQIISILVHGTNDGPVIDAAPVARTTAEDTDFTFAGANAVSDIDTDVLTVTLTANHGTVTLDGLANLTVGAGVNGTATLRSRGSAADINAALDGMVFHPASNYNGAATVVVETPSPSTQPPAFGATRSATAQATFRG